MQKKISHNIAHNYIYYLDEFHDHMIYSLKGILKNALYLEC